MRTLQENNINRGKKAIYTYATSKRNYGEYSRTRDERVEMKRYNEPLGRINQRVESVKIPL